MIRVAGMYMTGQGGFQKNDTQAANWFRKAAEAGDVVRMRNLGLMYENGRGLPKDEAQAVTWFRKAADGGDSTAADELKRLNK